MAAHQDEKKNEKAVKREAGEERKHEADFNEAECYPSAVIQWVVQPKNGWGEKNDRDNWDSREGQHPF